jgi:hypothetical protein
MVSNIMSDVMIQDSPGIVNRKREKSGKFPGEEATEEKSPPSEGAGGRGSIFSFNPRLT